jgi:hypothetical protein
MSWASPAKIAAVRDIIDRGGRPPDNFAGNLMLPLRPPGPRINIDKAQTFKFLRLIDGGAAKFTFQTFAEKGDSRTDILPRISHSSSLTTVWLEHEQGAGIYVTVNETDLKGRKSENIKRIRAVWVEDDHGFDGVFPLAPSMIVESSPGHFHRYWLVSDNCRSSHTWLESLKRAASAIHAQKSLLGFLR